MKERAWWRVLRKHYQNQKKMPLEFYEYNCNSISLRPVSGLACFRFRKKKNRNMNFSVVLYGNVDMIERWPVSSMIHILAERDREGRGWGGGLAWLVVCWAG